MNEIRTILAGGSPLLQAGIAAALAPDPRLQLVGQVSNAREGAVQAGQYPCEVLILNAEVPHLEAAMALEHMSEAACRSKVLVLTENESRDEMLATLNLGVHGYGIRHALWPEDLRAAVLAVARQGVWVCPLATRQLLAATGQPSTLSGPERGRKMPLSHRELEVLRLAADELREEQIAGILHLSKNTIKTYLRRIREKLEVGSRAEALRLAVQLGLLPDRRVRLAS